MSKRNLNIIDTNIVIRFLVADHPKLYREALNIFSEIENGNMRAILLESVFAEIVFVLEKIYRVERTIIAELLEKIVTLKGIVSYNRELFINALEIYRNRNIDIVDCLICAYSKINDIRILSFDKDLKRC